MEQSQAYLVFEFLLPLPEHLDLGVFLFVFQNESHYFFHFLIFREVIFEVVFHYLGRKPLVGQHLPELFDQLLHHCGIQGDWGSVVLLCGLLKGHLQVVLGLQVLAKIVYFLDLNLFGEDLLTVVLAGFLEDPLRGG